MNREIGFGRRLLQILEEEGLSYEHTPSGIDNMSVILQEGRLRRRHGGSASSRGSARSWKPTDVEVERGLALDHDRGRGHALHRGSGRQGDAGAGRCRREYRDDEPGLVGDQHDVRRQGGGPRSGGRGAVRRFLRASRAAARPMEVRHDERDRHLRHDPAGRRAGRGISFSRSGKLRWPGDWTSSASTTSRAAIPGSNPKDMDFFEADPQGSR